MVPAINSNPMENFTMTGKLNGTIEATTPNGTR
jgi:hypothetical protein